MSLELQFSNTVFHTATNFQKVKLKGDALCRLRLEIDNLSGACRLTFVRMTTFVATRSWNCIDSMKG